MKRKNVLLIVTLFLVQCAKAQISVNLQQKLNEDSTLISDLIDKEIVKQVTQSKTPPPQEKVKYFNQVTKYGFKNLFANSTYNPTQPYSAQINDNASSFIDSYVKSHSSYLTKMKDWGKPYFNLIESVLQQYGLPKELKYIAVIESNLKTAAVSKKGAGGPWQFMPATARAMGLTINAYTDERTDYYKSTHAACKYLLQLYGQLNDWLLVMAAYNGGPGRVFSAIKRSGSRSFWDLQYYLPEESRTYVKRFIATHYIMEGDVATDNSQWDVANGKLAAPTYAALSTGRTGGTSYVNPYNIKIDLGSDELNGIETQGVSGKYNSLVIAKNIGMDIQQFNRLNPRFDQMMANNGSYDLRLPEEKMQVFAANKYNILNECVQVLLTNDAVITKEINNKTIYKKHGKSLFKNSRKK